jgi:hypothetical protein
MTRAVVQFRSTLTDHVWHSAPWSSRKAFEIRRRVRSNPTSGIVVLGIFPEGTREFAEGERKWKEVDPSYSGE